VVFGLGVFEDVVVVEVVWFVGYLVEDVECVWYVVLVYDVGKVVIFLCIWDVIEFLLDVEWE